uniref:Uncharacterized protein n=1 Tax=Amphimedon queenslandica TaxID=400682 RepID=A0A1X7USR5_AMPQE
MYHQGLLLFSANGLSIVSSLQEENDSLQTMLHPQPDALRPLYVYESKMLLIIKRAQNSAKK